MHDVNSGESKYLEIIHNIVNKMVNLVQLWCTMDSVRWKASSHLLSLPALIQCALLCCLKDPWKCTSHTWQCVQDYHSWHRHQESVAPESVVYPVSCFAASSPRPWLQQAADMYVGAENMYYIQCTKCLCLTISEEFLMHIHPQRVLQLTIKYCRLVYCPKNIGYTTYGYSHSLHYRSALLQLTFLSLGWSLQLLGRCT